MTETNPATDSPPTPTGSPANTRPMPRRHGADGRTRHARRIKMAIACLCEELRQPLGFMSYSRRALVVDAAGLIVRTEELQAAMARGEAVDADALVRLSGAKMRVLDALGLSPAGQEARRAAEEAAAIEERSRAIGLPVFKR